MNIEGIGIDAVKIDRFQAAVQRYGDKFVEKIFTEREMQYANNKKSKYLHMAGKFAAKEAVKKALPNGAEIGLNWGEIEVLNEEDGKPYVILHGVAKGLMKKFKLSQVLVSISHTRDLATSNAMVVSNG